MTVRGPVPQRSAPQARQNLPWERWQVRPGQPGPSQGSAREGGRLRRSDGVGSKAVEGRSGMVFSGYSCQAEWGALHGVGYLECSVGWLYGSCIECV